MKHGEAQRVSQPCSIEYRTWGHMIGRCYGLNDSRYKDYGGRGIEVCKRWRYSYSMFLKDMGRRPSIDYSLDRINVNGDYKPSNCRWATRSEQMKNKRKKVYCKRGHLRKKYEDRWRGCKICSRYLHRLRYLKNKFQ